MTWPHTLQELRTAFYQQFNLRCLLWVGQHCTLQQRPCIDLVAAQINCVADVRDRVLVNCGAVRVRKKRLAHVGTESNVAKTLRCSRLSQKRLERVLRRSRRIDGLPICCGTKAAGSRETDGMSFFFVVSIHVRVSGAECIQGHEVAIGVACVVMRSMELVPDAREDGMELIDLKPLPKACSKARRKWMSTLRTSSAVCHTRPLFYLNCVRLYACLFGVRESERPGVPTRATVVSGPELSGELREARVSTKRPLRCGGAPLGGIDSRTMNVRPCAPRSLNEKGCSALHSL